MERASRARSACLLALLVLLPAAARAQRTTHDPEYVVTNWQTENGLPDNSATAIAQTDDGYLWLGTLKGLVRFDGARFTVFDPANTPGLPSAEILDLHLDRAGRLWVGTRRGLASLHAGRWRSFGSADGWAGGSARRFAETAEGGLYVATSDGKVLRRVNERFEALPEPRPGNRDAFFPWVDEAGRLCLLQTGFAAAWTGERWQPLTLPTEPERGASFGWARARDGSLLGAGGRTLVRVHGGRVERRALNATLEAFSSLTEDSHGFTWFSSSERGLYRIARDGSTRLFSRANGFPSDEVRGVFEDRQGNLWVGTSGGGLVRLRPRRFTSYGKEQGLPLATTSVAIGGDGVVHVAAIRYGLHEIRGNRATATPVPAGLADPQTVLVDRSGRLWVGTDRAGLYLSQAGRWTALLPRPRTVSSLFEDSRARVWAGTTADVLVWDDPARAPRVLPVSADAPDVRCFAEDVATGTLWAGGADGLFRLEGSSFARVPGPDPLARFGVASLHVSDESRLWVGTADGGLWLRTASGWADVGARTGLTAAAVAGLREQDGLLWAATNRGVWRTDMKRLVAAASEPGSSVAWQSFDVGDGLPSEECSSTRQPSIARDASGRLWFCTLRGLGVVDPRRLDPSTDDTPVHVERFTYTDRAGRAREAAGWPEAEVEVPAGSRDLGLLFTAIDLSAPEKVLFSSRLERDGRAIASTVSPRREARVPTLAPGRYLFRLRARNGDGVWSRRSVDLRFRVLPFFWQTPWFRIGGLLLAAVAIALVTRRVTRARARRSEVRDGAHDRTP